MNSINIAKKEDCCGCSACVNVCPKQCIEMRADFEGFAYPTVNNDLCINCGLCKKACPITNSPLKMINEKPLAFVAQNLDESKRIESSSGGMFSLIAEYVINKGGVVFGAAFDVNWQVRHISVDDVDSLYKLRGSKYVQSDIGNSYKDAKNLLEKGIWVCYSGTPCQIAGLRNFLRKDYETLVLVDVICHGVPSPKVWNKYIDFHTNEYGPIEAIFFRNKKFGFAGSTMAIFYKSGKRTYLGQELQFHKETFFRDLSTRPSCYECRFKNQSHVSDISLFDCWHVNEFNSSKDDDLGTSAVLVHSEKGKRIIKELENKMWCETVDFDKLVSLDGKMVLQSIKKNEKREEFFKDLDVKNVPEMIAKWTPLTLKKRIVQLIKPTIHRLGILNKLKRLV